MVRVSNSVFNEQLKDRTKVFALKVINQCCDLPKNGIINILSKQLVRSASSVAANYRAACRARSKAEFYSKICIVVEEADETQFWIEMFIDVPLIINHKDEFISLYKEISEILAIVTTIKHKLK